MNTKQTQTQPVTQLQHYLKDERLSLQLKAEALSVDPRGQVLLTYQIDMKRVLLSGLMALMTLFPSFVFSNENIIDDFIVSEICDNGIDDDGDGLVDCADPECGSDCASMDCSDGVTLLAQGSASATGSGAAGMPSISNLFIPEGKNRIVFVIASFEREHCQPGDVCDASNMAGTGLGDNWATQIPVTDNFVMSANFAGTGGDIDAQNHLTLPDGDLRFVAQYGFPSGLEQAGAFYSRESYFIAIYENEINTILGGANSGDINITLPDAKLPLDEADDATLMTYVFANVEQSNEGIVRAGVNSTVYGIVTSSSSLSGNYSITISDFDNGQEPDEAEDGLLIFGMSGLGLPTTNGGFHVTNGFQELTSLTTNTGTGDFTTYNEADGISVSTQFRNGPTSGVIDAVSMQSAASSSVVSNGGFLVAFKLESCSCDATVNANGETTICSGGSTTISATASGGATPYTYAWSHDLGNGASHSVNPSSSITYTVTLTDANNCTATDQVTITVNQTPTADAGADTDLCRFFNTTLSATATGGTAPYTYSWSHAPGTGNDLVIAPLNTTTYTVTVTSDNGCNDTDQITITVDNCTEICGNGDDDDGDGLTDCADSDCGPTVDLGTNLNNCTETDINLSATASGGDGALTISWSHGLGTGADKTVAPAATTTYSVTVTAPSGCTATDQITVNVVPCSENCYNGIDDDGDNLIDCADPDCQAVAAPQLNPDSYTTCPGIPYSNRVTYNDDNLQNPAFSIAVQPTYGTVTIDETGKFIYTPNGLDCTSDSFIYQVCNQAAGCCATATVDITLGDNTFPVLTNVPADLTISCDDMVPDVPTVTGFDECPGLYITYEETSDQLILGACETYTITRTWTAEDFCGNNVSQSQKISVVDMTKPEIFQVYTLENGKRLVAGASQRVTNNWKYVPFPITFSSAPVVLTQVSTNNDLAAIVARQKNVSMQGFELKVTEEEAADGKHSNESVSWVAIEPGALDGNMQYVSGTLANVTDMLDTLEFGQTFGAAPLLFSSINTDKEMDAASVKVQSIGTTQAELFIQEESSADGETGHANENIGFLALKDGNMLRDRRNDIFGEAGKMNVSNGWATVNLSGSYTKPVVICGSLSDNDTDPAVIRVRNVTQSSFEVRMQEWDYLDGNHASEVISWMVVEGSIPGNQGYYCAGKANHLQPNVNVFAIDNCDAITAFGYQENESNTGTGLLTTRTWMAIDDCGNTSIVSRYDTCVVPAVKVKTLLYGAAMNTGANPLMRDDLREQEIVPVQEPYTDLPSFSHVEYQHESGPVSTEPMITICMDDDGTPTTLEVPQSELHLYLNNGALVGDCADNPNGMVTICHKPGTPAEKTKVIPQSALFGHLGHGDVIGPCSGSVPTDGIANPDFQTIADGNWSDPAVWQGGNVPPFTDINNMSISITNNVTVQTSNIQLKNNSELYMSSGSLTMLNGNFSVEKSKVTFVNSVFDGSAAGNFEITKSEGVLIIDGCTVKVGQNFTNKGTRILDDVNLEVGESMHNISGKDTLRHVCAIIDQNVSNSWFGKMHLEDVKMKLPYGSFWNLLVDKVTGENLIILTENGSVSNIGTWTLPITQYCVADSLLIPTAYLPSQNECVDIANHFNPCDCEGDLLDANGTGNGGGTTTTTVINEETVNAGNSQGNGEIDPVLLEVTGDDAIVDWVLLELRDQNDESEILGYATVGLQRDGDVITEDGDDVIKFPGLGEDYYYVALRHRNHLGMMTEQPIYLSTNSVPLVDFSDPDLDVWGGYTAGRIMNGKRLMWSGDFNLDGKVIYQGPYNDAFFLFSRILADDGNENYLANYIVFGYDQNDVNLDGKVIYQGPGNDRAPLLYHSILAHPANSSFLSNFIVSGQLP